MPEKEGKSELESLAQQEQESGQDSELQTEKRVRFSPSTYERENAKEQQNVSLEHDVTKESGKFLELTDERALKVYDEFMQNGGKLLLRKYDDSGQEVRSQTIGGNRELVTVYRGAIIEARNQARENANKLDGQVEDLDPSKDQSEKLLEIRQELDAKIEELTIAEENLRQQKGQSTGIKDEVVKSSRSFVGNVKRIPKIVKNKADTVLKAVKKRLPFSKQKDNSPKGKTFASDLDTEFVDVELNADERNSDEIRAEIVSLKEDLEEMQKIKEGLEQELQEIKDSKGEGLEYLDKELKELNPCIDEISRIELKISQEEKALKDQEAIERLQGEVDTELPLEGFGRPRSESMYLKSDEAFQELKESLEEDKQEAIPDPDAAKSIEDIIRDKTKEQASLTDELLSLETTINVLQNDMNVAISEEDIIATKKALEVLKYNKLETEQKLEKVSDEIKLHDELESTRALLDKDLSPFETAELKEVLVEWKALLQGKEGEINEIRKEVESTKREIQSLTQEIESSKANLESLPLENLSLEEKNILKRSENSLNLLNDKLVRLHKNIELGQGIEEVIKEKIKDVEVEIQQKVSSGEDISLSGNEAIKNDETERPLEGFGRPPRSDTMYLEEVVQEEQEYIAQNQEAMSSTDSAKSIEDIIQDKQKEQDRLSKGLAVLKNNVTESQKRIDNLTVALNEASTNDKESIIEGIIEQNKIKKDFDYKILAREQKLEKVRDEIKQYEESEVIQGKPGKESVEVSPSSSTKDNPKTEGKLESVKMKSQVPSIQNKIVELRQELQTLRSGPKAILESKVDSPIKQKLQKRELLRSNLGKLISAKEKAEAVIEECDKEIKSKKEEFKANGKSPSKEKSKAENRLQTLEKHLEYQKDRVTVMNDLVEGYGRELEELNKSINKQSIKQEKARVKEDIKKENKKLKLHSELDKVQSKINERSVKKAELNGKIQELEKSSLEKDLQEGEKLKQALNKTDKELIKLKNKRIELSDKLSAMEKISGIPSQENSHEVPNVKELSSSDLEAEHLHQSTVIGDEENQELVEEPSRNFEEAEATANLEPVLQNDQERVNSSEKAVEQGAAGELDNTRENLRSTQSENLEKDNLGNKAVEQQSAVSLEDINKARANLKAVSPDDLEIGNSSNNAVGQVSEVEMVLDNVNQIINNRSEEDLTKISEALQNGALGNELGGIVSESLALAKDQRRSGTLPNDSNQVDTHDTKKIRSASVSEVEGIDIKQDIEVSDGLDQQRSGTLSNDRDQVSRPDTKLTEASAVRGVDTKQDKGVWGELLTEQTKDGFAANVVSVEEKDSNVQPDLSGSQLPDVQAGKGGGGMGR